MAERVLVTGGAGYKGVKLVKKLLDRGHAVTLLDNFMYGYEPVLHLVENPRLDLIKRDIRNGVDGLENYDVVFHLAGISGLPACESNPTSAQSINVDATKTLVDGLSKDQLLIYASTTSFYGRTGSLSSEESPVDPVSMYGVTKHRAEQLVAARENSINLRFATVFGPSPKMRMDLMVNEFTYRAVKEKAIVLYDSYAKRTFIHIDDAVDCYLFALDNQTKMVGGIFNAGGAHMNYSKLEIAQKVQQYVDVRIIESDIKDKDVRHFVASYEKIAALGFTPRKSIDDGVRELLKMYTFYETFSHFRII